MTFCCSLLIDSVLGVEESFMMLDVFQIPMNVYDFEIMILLSFNIEDSIKRLW